MNTFNLYFQNFLHNVMAEVNELYQTARMILNVAGFKAALVLYVFGVILSIYAFARIKHVP